VDAAGEGDATEYIAPTRAEGGCSVWGERLRGGTDQDALVALFVQHNIEPRLAERLWAMAHRAAAAPPSAGAAAPARADQPPLADSNVVAAGGRGLSSQASGKRLAARVAIRACIRAEPRSPGLLSRFAIASALAKLPAATALHLEVADVTDEFLRRRGDVFYQGGSVVVVRSSPPQDDEAEGAAFEPFALVLDVVKLVAAAGGLAPASALLTLEELDAKVAPLLQEEQRLETLRLARGALCSAETHGGAVQLRHAVAVSAGVPVETVSRTWVGFAWRLYAGEAASAHAARQLSLTVPPTARAHSLRSLFEPRSDGGRRQPSRWGAGIVWPLLRTS